MIYIFIVGCLSPVWLLVSSIGSGEIFVLLFFALLALIVYLNFRTEFANSNRPLKAGKNLIFSCLVTYGLDQHFGLWTLTESFPQKGIYTYLLASILLVAIAGFVFFVINKWQMDGIKIITAFLCSALFFNILSSYKYISYRAEVKKQFKGSVKNTINPKNKNGVSKKTIVLILDTMTGLEGIDTSLEAGLRAQQSIRKLYSDFGFKLYGAAYSMYSGTVQSIPASINFDASTNSVKNKNYSIYTEFIDRGRKKTPLYSVTENKLFGLYADSGVTVFENSHITYCQNDSVEKCVQFDPYAKDIDYLPGFRNTWLSRVTNRYRDGRSVAAQILWRALDSFNAVDILRLGWSTKAGFKYRLNNFSEEINQGSTGLYFAHLFATHVPFAYDSQCNYDKDIERNLVSQPEKSNQHYKEIICANKFLRGFLEKLDFSGTLENSTVVIMSDHGDRMEEKRGPEGFITSDHSNLFAVRKMGEDENYSGELLPVQSLLSKYLNPRHLEPNKLLWYDGDKLTYLEIKKKAVRVPPEVVGE
jgi:hypothetical protein